MSKGTVGFVKQFHYNAVETGINEYVLLDGTYAKTSSAISISGYNYLTVRCSLTWAACSDIRMYLETSDDQAFTVAHRVPEIRSTATAGKYTSADWNLNVESIGASDAWEWSFPVNGKFIRLVFDNPSTDATTDTFTVTASIGNV